MNADTRTRILEAAIELLTRGGRDAVTTRAVSEAAGVQAPTLYRMFTDKGGLLEAVAEHGFALYLGAKTVRPAGHDPVENLRTGWDLHVGFGLAYPAIYKLMYGDPNPGAQASAAAHSFALLKEHVHQVAVDGRLRVSEQRAADLIHASACGTVLTLLAHTEKDMAVSRLAREAVLSAITTEMSTLTEPGVAAAAVTLQSLLPDATSLSGAERTLLTEWLDRLAKDG
jgi:AcrR family transcriptional regulator